MKIRIVALFEERKSVAMFQRNAFFLNQTCFYIYIYIYKSIYVCLCVYAGVCLLVCVHMHTLRLYCDCFLSQNIICGNEMRREN